LVPQHPENVGDWGASYTYAWVEKDAVFSPFSLSKIDYVTAKGTEKGSSNVIAHILRVDYVLFPNFQVTAKAHFIDALDRKSATTTAGIPLAGKENDTLLRAQLDAILKF
jgi:hypothetical protein